MDPFTLEVFRESTYPTPYAASPLLPYLLLSLAVQKHTPHTKTEFRPEYDYVIVGAGSAGSVVASRLSEIPCVSVLVLEAGKEPPRLTDIPAISRSFFNTDIDWQYVTEPQKYTCAGQKDRRVPWPSGKVIGGSSIFNVMLYVRGNRRNYDEWARLGATGWSYDEVLPYFLKLEDNTDPLLVETVYHTTGGPVTMSRPAYNPEKKIAEVEAVVNSGFRFVDPNGADQVGFYDYQATSRKGQRCSTAKAYLVPCENRTNLDILANAMVRKILIEDKRAVGVEFDFQGMTHKVRARREVILSAGATNSPQLLMLSGIGPMSELQKYKIPLVADLPVGFNFQDHPYGVLVYEVDRRLPTFSEEIRNETNILDYINSRIGPLTAPEGIQLQSFLPDSDSNDSDIPDYCLYFAEFDKVVPTQLRVTQEVFDAFFVPLENKSVIYCVSQLLRPQSRGTVSLLSSNPYDQPRIDPNYLSDFKDVKDIVEGMKTCQIIMKDPAMKRIGAKLADVKLPGCEEYRQDEDMYFRCIVRFVVNSLSHMCGTAKMGDPADPNTVVDPQLRVKGIRRLRVVDASVMPTITWGNTNIPTIMIAEKASDMIKSTIQCIEDL